MSINTFFFYFDGTLQGFETHQISNSTKEALAILKAKNYQIFLATGRNLTDLPEELIQLNFDGFINNNGGMCSDKNQIPFHVKYLPQHDVEALLAYEKEYPFAFSVMTEKGFSINRINSYVEKAFEFFGAKHPKLIDYSETDWDKILQMNFFVNKGDEHFLMQNVMTNSESSRWMDYFADINPKGINKMKAIKEMAKKYQFNLDKTMAFGDGANDILMLKGCSIGVAMGNAKDEVKQVADYITTSADDDGIWNALKHFKLI